MGISHFHVFHKKPAARRTFVEVLEKRADTPACPSGFYKSPTMGQTIDSLQPLPISWDPTCLTDKEIDIYLYSPGSDFPRIHVWESVLLSRGTYTAELFPRWWNATASQNLQISIVPAGLPPFMSNLPGGPVFTATYTEPAGGTPASADVNQIDSGITQVNDLSKAEKPMTPGKTAAAVILPLLFVMLCVGVYIKMKRNKGKDKRKAWSEAVDKRMSTISTDWKSVSGAGANAAIRNSMAVGVRNSSFSFGGIRPSSTYAVEGEDAGSAGVGADKRPMSQMRTGVGLRNPTALSSTERVSRVSFAPDTRQSRVSFADSRPSGESRRTRAFHSAYIPPVPALPDITPDAPSDNASEGTSASFSPRQTQGALTLTPEDIRARIGSSKGAKSTVSHDDVPNSGNSEMNDLLPALSMMRTGNDPSLPDDFLFSAPTAPAPSYPKPVTSTPQQMSSPIMSTMPMQPMPASVMSPDEMLRAYAERKKSMSAAKPITASQISYPMPVANASTPAGSSNNMRVLYNAATGTVSPTHTGEGAFDDAYDTTGTGHYDHGYDQSVAPAYPNGQYAAYDQNDQAYGYAGYGNDVVGGVGMTDAGANANAYPFGHHPNGSIGVGSYGGARYAIGDDEDDVAMAARGPYAGHAA